MASTNESFDNSSNNLIEQIMQDSSCDGSKRVDAEFYNRGCEELAKQLIGKLLVRIDGDKRLSGMIVEVGEFILE